MLRRKIGRYYGWHCSLLDRRMHDSVNQRYEGIVGLIDLRVVVNRANLARRDDPVITQALSDLVAR